MGTGAGVIYIDGNGVGCIQDTLSSRALVLAARAKIPCIQCSGLQITEYIYFRQK